MNGTNVSQTQIELLPGQQPGTQSRIGFWLTYVVVTPILMMLIYVLPTIFIGTTWLIKQHPLHDYAMIAAFVAGSRLGEIVAKMVAERVQG